MSSPTQRRSQRSSASATPRRDQREPEAPGSSPMQTGFGPDNQLRSEASQASDLSLQVPGQGTPRANGAQAPPSSSPLFFRSSPANAAANGVNVSSPLGQPPSSDGGQTPRASGQTIGGALILARCDKTTFWLTTRTDSSPIRYASSSSAAPRTAGNRTDALRSESSGLFVRSPHSNAPTAAINRRHDVDSDILSSNGLSLIHI